jgi:hypothetical protein
MSKSLVLGVAALLASTLAAAANGTNSTEIALNNLGDTFQVSQIGFNFAQVHNSGTGQSYGAGMEVTTQMIYKGVLLTDFSDNGNMQVWYDFSYPFETGGRWVAFGTKNGVTVTKIGAGTYTVITH